MARESKNSADWRVFQTIAICVKYPNEPIENVSNWCHKHRKSLMGLETAKIIEAYEEDTTMSTNIKLHREVRDMRQAVAYYDKPLHLWVSYLVSGQDQICDALYATTKEKAFREIFDQHPITSIYQYRALAEAAASHDTTVRFTNAWQNSVDNAFETCAETGQPIFVGNNGCLHTEFFLYTAVDSMRGLMSNTEEDAALFEKIIKEAGLPIADLYPKYHTASMFDTEEDFTTTAEEEKLSSLDIAHLGMTIYRTAEIIAESVRRYYEQGNRVEAQREGEAFAEMICEVENTEQFELDFIKLAIWRTLNKEEEIREAKIKALMTK